MTPDIVNPSPKARFRSEESNIKAHHELLQSAAFQRAEDMAVLSYNRSIAKAAANDPNPQVAGMVAGWKQIAVQEFLAEFHNLAEKPVEAQPPGVARTLGKG